MIDGKYEYFAFISYRWEDEKMARWLQEKLEHYKLPTSLREQNPNLPTHIRPIFRDKTDLNGHTLEESLMSALESSRYLIVVCSPLATQSDWVNRGIQKFIDLGREKDIIPFIVDGEANADDPKNECFPIALRSLKGERAIYGININDNGRDAAAVKVVSRMFDVKYDMLWNRFLLEQKKRRRYTVAGLVAAILIVAGVAGYIWMQNQELDKRNEQIETQYKELQAKNAQIEQQNKDLDAKSDSITNVNTALVVAKDSIQRAYEKLDLSERNLAKSNADLKESNIRLAEERDNVLKANWKMMENQALAVAEKARYEISNGNVRDAMLALLEVTPTVSSPRPYVPEVEAALRVALDSLNSNSFTKRHIASNISHLVVSGDSNYFTCLKNDGTLEIYDSHTFKKVKQLRCENFLSLLELDFFTTMYISRDQSQILLYDTIDVKVYSIDDGKLEKYYKRNEIDSIQYRHLFDTFVDTSNTFDGCFLGRCVIPMSKYGYCQSINTNTGIALFYEDRRNVEDSFTEYSTVLEDSLQIIGKYTLCDINKDSVLYERLEWEPWLGDYSISSICLSPNGSFLATSYYTGDIQSYNVNTGEIAEWKNINENEHYSHHISISADNSQLFHTSAFQNHIYVFDANDLVLVDSIPVDWVEGASCYALDASNYLIYSMNSIYQFTKGNNSLVRRLKEDALCVNEDSQLILIDNHEINYNLKCSFDNRMQSIYLPDFKQIVFDSSYGGLECYLLYKDEKRLLWKYQSVLDLYPVGCTSDYKYLFVQEVGPRGHFGMRVFDVLTGVEMLCTYDMDDCYCSEKEGLLIGEETFSDDIIILKFPMYNELLTECKREVNNMVLPPELRKTYFLE